MRKKYANELLTMQSSFLSSKNDLDRKTIDLEEQRLDFERQKHADQLRTRDRIDLSLDTYNNMRSQIRQLEVQVMQYEKLLNSIKITPELARAIRPESVHICTSNNYLTDHRAVTIEFECEPVIDFNNLSYAP